MFFYKNVSFVFIIGIKGAVSNDSIICVLILCYDNDAQTVGQLT